MVNPAWPCIRTCNPSIVCMYIQSKSRLHGSGLVNCPARAKKKLGHFDPVFKLGLDFGCPQIDSSHGIVALTLLANYMK